jgi:hypothetical protein
LNSETRSRYRKVKKPGRSTWVILSGFNIT